MAKGANVSWGRFKTLLAPGGMNLHTALKNETRSSIIAQNAILSMLRMPFYRKSHLSIKTKLNNLQARSHHQQLWVETVDGP